MQRSLNLLREFSLADGNNVLIHTGFEPSSNYLHHHLPLPHRPSFRQHQNQSSSRGGKVDTIDKLTLEGVEASQLCKLVSLNLFFCYWNHCNGIIGRLEFILKGLCYLHFKLLLCTFILQENQRTLPCWLHYHKFSVAKKYVDKILTRRT